MFKASQFKAIAFRRFTLMKRAWKLTTLSVVGTIIACALAIILNYLMVVLLSPKVKLLSFNDFDLSEQSIMFVNDGSFPDAAKINKKILDIFTKETGKPVQEFDFTSREDMNKWVYDHQIAFAEPNPIPMGAGFRLKDSAFIMDTFYNTSGFHESSEELLVEYLASRGLWKYIFGDHNDFQLSYVDLPTRQIDFGFGMSGPIIICAGFLATIPMIINQPINDITGEVRSYMISCTLTILPYWLSTFLIDLALWIVVTTVVWAIYLAAQIQSFLDNMLTSWYSIAVSGPSFILFIYCVSFLFNSPESANRQTFLIFLLIMLVPFVIEMIRYKENPIWLEWVYSLIPHLCIQRLLTITFQNIGAMKHNFSYYWTDDPHTKPFLIMEIVDIFIYGILLYIIEKVRIRIQNKMAQHSFGNYTSFFEEMKNKNEVTQEALDMEEEVKSSHDYAVRIENVSRLFFNTEGKPIPAVNCVSLGVKKGSLFGFLGANGAGKTTLIRMITSMLPPSDGKIEINGIDINEFNDPTAISICPQFNNHLCNEMTPDEHFQLYGMLFEMPIEEQRSKSDQLIKSLELEKIRDKPLRDLSQGDVRKLAIALSFYGPADIILLDEPTASLDPVARHNVQEMILENRGDKTFMLCTHLLSEAEFLCDMISIMVKGCVFTCGTPSHLTKKFGTDYKIDVLLVDDSNKTEERVNKFFKENLPDATLSIERPKARIYDIPATTVDLATLFTIMEQGMQGDNGFNYYTCSSSTLERVFMEIVKMSEESELP